MQKSATNYWSDKPMWAVLYQNSYDMKSMYAGVSYAEYKGAYTLLLLGKAHAT